MYMGLLVIYLMGVHSVKYVYVYGNCMHHTMVHRAALDRLSTDYRRQSTTTTTTRDLDVSTRSSLLAELSREPLVNLEIGGGDGGSRAEEHFAKIVGCNRRREDARRVSEPGELFEG